MECGASGRGAQMCVCLCFHRLQLEAHPWPLASSITQLDRLNDFLSTPDIPCRFTCVGGCFCHFSRTDNCHHVLCMPCRAMAQVELFAAELKSKEELESGVSGLVLDEQQQPQPGATAVAAVQPPYLLDALDKWESFAGGIAATGSTAVAATGPQAVTKAPPRLYKAPYCFEAVPVRPIMLDTASTCLSYPSLDHRLRKAEKKSVLSSLFGWRR